MELARFRKYRTNYDFIKSASRIDDLSGKLEKVERKFFLLETVFMPLIFIKKDVGVEESLSSQQISKESIQ